MRNVYIIASSCCCWAAAWGKYFNRMLSYMLACVVLSETSDVCIVSLDCAVYTRIVWNFFYFYFSCVSERIAICTGWCPTLSLSQSVRMSLVSNESIHFHIPTWKKKKKISQLHSFLLFYFISLKYLIFYC